MRGRRDALPYFENGFDGVRARRPDEHAGGVRYPMTGSKSLRVAMKPVFPIPQPFCRVGKGTGLC